LIIAYFVDTVTNHNTCVLLFNINVVEMDDMKSMVSTLRDEIAQISAVMQASRGSEGGSQAEELAASAFGRPGLHPHHKNTIETQTTTTHQNCLSDPAIQMK
jgi:hypothetical protein